MADEDPAAEVAAEDPNPTVSLLSARSLETDGDSEDDADFDPVKSGDEASSDEGSEEDDDGSGGAQSGVVKRVQGGLAQLGYNPGPIDGAMGPKTSEAIREYQRDHDLLIDGQATAQLAEHIERRL